ncbi:unnamed protein product [Moneuplotes crassus]|uniref:histidine kinase n=1 Tax=Euplotes crassus TaxID=5936 RepID=A0AAD1YBP1_EUPCR|nr:unnamed protein product [Moneuplotes crassus]
MSLRVNITGKELFRSGNNWGPVMNAIICTVTLILIFVSILQQEKLFFRVCVLLLDYIIIYFLIIGIKKSDWMANYCGIICSIIMYVQMTEVNLKFTYFRINEGLLIQITMSLVFGTCVTTNWKIACITQVLLHIYGFFRLKSKFVTLSDYYYTGSICSLAFFIVGAYSYSNTLKHEFIASYKQRKTLEGQKAMLDCVPEGVVIINNNKEFKYLNPKIKETLDIGSFYRPDSVRDELKANQFFIKKELDRIIKRYSFEYSNAHLNQKNDPDKFLTGLFKEFTVECKDFQDDPQPVDFGEIEEEVRIDKFEKYREGHLTLAQFLENERSSIMESVKCSKETKISMKYDFASSRYEHLKREFIVKTAMVDSNDILQTDVLFMHMFIETTQISQLEEAKAQNHYQRQMLSNVSHEFRTPLNSIMASLELMRIEEYGKDNRFVQIASSSCNILAMLVEDILDNAKIESGVFQINEEVFTITQCINEIQEVFTLQAAGKRLELRINIQDKLKELPILSDKGRIKQVIMNLVSNALKFTDRGSITIEIHEKRNQEESKMFGSLDSLEESKFLENSRILRNMREIPDENIESSNSILSRHDCTNYFFYTNTSRFENVNKPESEFLDTIDITLKVTDTGIGISKVDQKSLFKLFGKLSSNHNRNKTGCGLGLTICKKIIEKLGGTISLHSEENVGTTVECHFTCKY